MIHQLGYLDAGTGSLIVSVVVAGAAGLGVFFRLGWRRITGFLSPTRRAEHRAGANEEPAERGLDEQGPAVGVRTGRSADPRS